ncbi:unnamed protein product [Orchesella dallaii]|uniref:Gustatory receptor n=1 Tax=Orchesella dallaii TaxID=48710 RepID=A0ABP1QE17_9HEXA
MALKGLELATVLGWFTGIIILDHPWGVPSLSSWLTFSTFYSLSLFGVYFFLMVDFLFNNSRGLHLNENRKFAKWVVAFSISQYILVALLQRFGFIFNAKRLGKLMQTLSQQMNQQKRQRIYTMQFVGIHLGFLVLLIGSTVMAINFIKVNASRPSWIHFLGLGNVGYAIIYPLFAFVPLMLTSQCCFAIISVVCTRIPEIISEFYDQVRYAITTITSDTRSELEIFNIIHMRSKLEMKKGAKEIAGLSLKPCRHDVVNRFEEMKDLLKLTDEAISSLVFLCMVGMTLNLVGTASQIFVIGHTGTSLFIDIVHLSLCALHSTLLQVGQRSREMQKQAKTQLYTEFLNLPWSTEKAEMEEVVQEIVEWEWRLSACGFFHVDRRLASGIFSLVLNYVVIFVQLNIALDEPPCSGNDMTLRNNTEAS